MTTNIKLKKSSVVGRAPGTGDLDYGEIAINYADGKLYYKNSSNQIKSFIDSAAVQNLINNVPTGGGGVSGGLDSAAVYTLIDSAYIQAREANANGVSSVSQYNIIADSGQITFNNVSFVNDDNIQVFLNGILLKPIEDYTTSNNNTITLTDGADSGDEFRLIAFETYSQRVSLDDYSYTCDSGQSTFSGVDNNNNTLSYTPGNVQVHYNGLLLVEGQDYTATTGTSVVLTEVADSGDAIVITAISGDSAYIRNAVSESFLSTIIDSAYVQARIGDVTGGTDSATVISLISSTVDSSYVNNRVNLSSYATQSYVTTQINNIVDGAPEALNTLNELAAAINDDDSAYATLNTLINTKTSYDSTNAANQIEAYGYLTSAFDSVNALGLIDSTYIQSRQLDSVAVAALASNAQLLNNLAGSYYLDYSNFTNTPNILDSTNVLSIANTIDKFDSAWIIARVDSAVDAIIDGAPTALNTLNEIAAALNNDDSAYNSLVALISQKTDYDSANASGQIEAYGYTTFDSNNTIGIIDSAYVQARQTIVDSVTNATNAINATLLAGYNSSYYINYNNFTNTPNVLDSADVALIAQAYDTDTNVDSAFVTGIIDSAYIQARQTAGTDSAATIALITSTVDSAYIALREANASGGLDSAAVLNLIPDGTKRGLRTYEFIADSGQTVFSSADRDGNTLTISRQNAAVFANGILLVDSNDYTVSNGNIILAEAADSGDFITIQNIVAGGVDSVAVLNLIDSAYIANRTAAGTDSATVQAIVEGYGYSTYDSTNASAQIEAYGYLTNAIDSTNVIALITANDQQRDSAFVTGIVDASYIQSNQITYDTSDFTDSTYVTSLPVSTFTNDAGYTTYDSTNTVGILTTYATQTYVTNAIDSIVGAAPGALDTLQELAAALGNDSNFSTTITNLIATKIDSANAIDIITSYGYSTYDSTNAASQIEAYGYSTYDSVNAAAQIEAYGYLTNAIDSANVISLITANDQQRDSAFVAGIIDSSYVQARQITQDFAYSSLTGTPNVLDSTNVTTLITNYGYSTYDSTNAASQIEAYGYLTSAIDSAGVIALITANDQQRDSAFVTSIIDSAYINARVIASSGTDSATVLTLVTNTVDSAYVLARANTVGRVGLNENTIIADSGQTTFNVSYVPSAVQVYFNGILLSNGYDYTASNGSSIVLTSAADSGDTVVINTIGGDSVRVQGEVESIVDSAYINARVDAVSGTDSATVVAIITSYNYSTFDSTNANDLITNYGYTTYDSANTTGMLSSYATQSYVTTEINNLIDGAPGTLNTLNEIAAALNDDDSAYATLVTLIGTKSSYDSTNAAGQIEAYGYLTNAIDSARITSMLAADSFSIGGTIIGDGKIEIKNTTGSTPSYVDLYCEVSNAHYTRIQSEAHANYSGNVTLTTPTTSGTLALTSDIVDSAAIIALIQANDQQRDSAFVTGIIDSAYVAARTTGGTDSATVISLITSTVDSAYVQARQTTVSGGSGGTDSATVLSLVQGLVDSDYVQARQSSGAGSSTSVNVTMYEYLPDSGATVISGNDRDGLSLSYQTGNIQVFRNGILLIDSNDYSAIDQSTITLTTPAVSGDYISIASWTEGTAINLSNYEFIADSGQTAFSGIATNGEALTYTPGNIIVHLNGILLGDSADYTATNGSTITLTAAADSADILSVIAFTGSSSINDYVEATTSITAIANKKYIVDTSTAVTLTLPASPLFGDEVKVIDGTGNAGTNNITINRNSNKILGADSDFTLDVNRAAIDLVYYNATQGWIISGNS
jgi:hypothetical protein